MEGICLRYRLGPSDIVRAVEVHQRRRFGATTLLAWAVSLAALGVVLERDAAPAALVWACYLLSGLAALAGLGCPLAAAWRWHRQRRLFAPTRLTVGAQGISVQGGPASGEHAWSGFERYAVLPQLFMLYRGPEEFVLVPKRAFGSVADLERFRSALRQKLGAPFLGADSR
jgi:hypothetical protein